MDQSLVYDLVDHPTLLRKLQAVGLDKHSVQLMKTYLMDRQQTVQVKMFTSLPLHTGPISVIQGSALSCVLYIIFTLDLPLIFDHQATKVEIEENSTKPKSLTTLMIILSTCLPQMDKPYKKLLKLP